MAIEHICKNCGKTFSRFTTLQNICGTCQYNKMLEINKSSTAKKPIKRLGKVTIKWLETRKDWISKNPPDDRGYWTCYLQISPVCPKRVTIDELSLDHIISRSRRPDLRFDLTNIAPSCYPCNSRKGSQAVDKVKNSP